jgi:hypothetical protein
LTKSGSCDLTEGLELPHPLHDAVPTGTGTYWAWVSCADDFAGSGPKARSTVNSDARDL